MVADNRIAIFCALVAIGLLGACSGTQTARSGAKSAALSGPTCAQQAASVRAYMGDLQRARAAIAADPLVVRKDSSMSTETSVPLANARLITPMPEVFTVEITGKDVFVAGERLDGFIGSSDVLAAEISHQFENAMCPADEGVKGRDIALVAHPGASWQQVQQFIEAADDAGAARVLLGFSTPSGVSAPAAEALTAAADLDPRAAFAACPGLAQALTADGDTKAVEQALRACECAVDVSGVRAFAYRRSGLVERDGHVPAALALPFVDDNEVSRSIIAANPGVSWAHAHAQVVDAVAKGGAFVAWQNGEGHDDSRLEMPTNRGDKHCVTLAKQRKAAEERKRIADLKPQEGTFASLTGTDDFSSGLDDASVFAGLPGDEMSCGCSPRGCDTGWSTIGKGIEDMDEHQDSAPQVRIGKAVVRGALDKQIVRLHILRKLPRIKDCYEKQLSVRPGIKGTVMTTFVIRPFGSVTEVRASGVDKEVATCISSAISGIRFPKPDGSIGMVDVRYSFVFNPTGG